MNNEALLRQAVEFGDGVLWFAPTWVTRPASIGEPGGRLRLDIRDLYPYGPNQGGVCERWLASTVRADNPGGPDDEGLSYVVFRNQRGELVKVLLRDLIINRGDEILGKDVMSKYGGLKAFAKFFDYKGPLPLHLHQKDEQVKKYGKEGKPEAYYFPPQLNYHEGRFPYTFFGLQQSVKKEDIIRCLRQWNQGDNGIIDLSIGYRIRIGTSWLVQTGILHAPGSLLTYEPQKTSDVFIIYQSMVEGRFIPWELAMKDIPEEFKHDPEYIVEFIEWDLNTDPEFKRHHFVPHIRVRDEDEMHEEGYYEKWIVYGCEDFSAKELTVYPKRTVVIKDAEAYGFVVVQGKGKIGRFEVESPTLVRFGEITYDEFFVSREVAREGVEITNTGNENLVLLKHFGPGNSEAPSKIE
jgi:hypothetical protein